MTPREAYIALNMMDKLGPVRVRALIETLGSPEAIFRAGKDDLMKTPGIGAELAGRIMDQQADADPAAEEEKAAALGAKIVTFLDEAYPSALKKIYDPPLALYVLGTLDSHDKHALAMVGTRHATHYGLSVADRLAYQLAKSGFTIVSGLARGIDTAAHKGALKGGGRTLAVLGSALDQLYPPENKELARTIAGQGAVISEYCLGRAPDRTTFPYRNRVVSGLSMGVVVVEAGISSGAMNTADQALEQGRSVMAVPGRLDSAGSKGPHRLIKNGARLVEDVEDVLQEFEFLVPPETRQKAKDLDSRPQAPLMPEEQAVVRALWEEPLDVDTLIRRCNLTVARISTLLIGLEMKRVVRMLPGRIVRLADGLKEAAGEASRGDGNEE
ncbi:MAG: DNA protecting protein DprA [Lentisphaerae bacterium GWF2_57_35]|nr:MAG: DNA protecting protein DprA [Lentisphaerae bacterium GWF2_57_35]